MSETTKPQTGVRRGDDGRFTVFCRVCPKSAWRRLAPNERTGGWYDSGDEAAEQGKRHRRSEAHQETVIRMSSTQVTDEERVLARIFGGDTAGPCEMCGFEHSTRLTCLTAARIRDKELPR
jgi:hypothetical protein